MTGWKKLYLREPHSVVQPVERVVLGHRIQPPITEVGTHEGRVFLFHEAVVVFVKGSGTGQPHALDGIPPQLDQVRIEKLTAVVGV